MLRQYSDPLDHPDGSVETIGEFRMLCLDGDGEMRVLLF